MITLISTKSHFIHSKNVSVFSHRFHPLAVLGCGRGGRGSVVGDGPADVPVPDERVEKLSETDAIRGSKGERDQREEQQIEKEERKRAIIKWSVTES